MSGMLLMVVRFVAFALLGAIAGASVANAVEVPLWIGALAGLVAGSVPAWARWLLPGLGAARAAEHVSLALLIAIAVAIAARGMWPALDDTLTAVFSAGRQALRLIASRVSAQDFFLGCQRAGLAVGVVNSPEEAFEDAHFKARGFHVPVRHEALDRTVIYPGAPYAFTRTPWAITRPAPALGEHTDEVFAEIDG